MSKLHNDISLDGVVDSGVCAFYFLAKVSRPIRIASCNIACADMVGFLQPSCRGGNHADMGHTCLIHEHLVCGELLHACAYVGTPKMFYMLLTKYTFNDQ
jgi:hypothetical protein